MNNHWLNQQDETPHIVEIDHICLVFFNNKVLRTNGVWDDVKIVSNVYSNYSFSCCVKALELLRDLGYERVYASNRYIDPKIVLDTYGIES